MRRVLLAVLVVGCGRVEDVAGPKAAKPEPEAKPAAKVAEQPKPPAAKPTPPKAAPPDPERAAGRRRAARISLFTTEEQRWHDAAEELKGRRLKQVYAFHDSPAARYFLARNADLYPHARRRLIEYADEYGAGRLLDSQGFAGEAADDVRVAFALFDFGEQSTILRIARVYSEGRKLNDVDKLFVRRHPEFFPKIVRAAEGPD
jgi:hypothetical protein